jgi:hypothetical protein
MNIKMHLSFRWVRKPTRKNMELLERLPNSCMNDGEATVDGSVATEDSDQGDN